jgi:molecular chaperone Hsp33
VALLEDRCREISDFSQRLVDCNGELFALLQVLFPDLDPHLLEDTEASQEVSFHCPCSRRRSVKALKLLGQAELTDMLQEDGKAELTCHFCNEVYLVEAPELQELIAELSPMAG